MSEACGPPEPCWADGSPGLTATHLKGRCREQAVRLDHLRGLPGKMPICLQMMESMIASASPPMDPRRVSR